MSVGRRIAAPDVTALQAQTQVDPTVAGRQALLTTLWRVRLGDPRLACEMSALARSHASFLYADGALVIGGRWMRRDAIDHMAGWRIRSPAEPHPDGVHPCVSRAAGSARRSPPFVDPVDGGHRHRAQRPRGSQDRAAVVG